MQPKGITGLVALVDPAVHGLGPLVELGRGEPETDLVVGGLDRVGTVADVATNLELKSVLQNKFMIHDKSEYK